jgi:ABC-2 type transport system ATP-binding protein
VTVPPDVQRAAKNDAIVVDDVWKRFRLYRDRNQSLKSTLLRRGRARYDEFWALRGVSLSVPRGSTFALVGRNGSGKSTLLKCMARILRQERGTIAIDGRMSALLELGAGFHPELSGRDNVYLNGSILGLRRREVDAMFDEIVEFAGLARFIDTPVKNYSSGMYVRLGFSVAISVQPEVLLVDEVLAVGDEEFQRRCNERFADLRERGTTIVVVSHALDIVRRMCDLAAWLDGGGLRELGSTSEVVDAYVEDVQAGRATDSEATNGRHRYGSRELRIEHAEIVGESGGGVLRTGETVSVRLEISSSRPIADASVGLVIHSLAGLEVAGTSTHGRGVSLPVIDGPCVVELSIDRLPLLPGTFEVGVSLTDSHGLHTFDSRPRLLRFDVAAGETYERAPGLVVLEGSWSVRNGAPGDGSAPAPETGG